MSLKSIQILGVNVTVNPREEILEYVGKYLEDTSNFKLQTVKLKTKPLIIVTPNPEQVVLAKRDKQFAQILNRADVALPDGIGISLAMKLLNKLSARDRIPGVEFMEDLVGLAAKEGMGIGLIGGRGGVAVKALECLKRKHPKLQGWAEEPGEIKVDQLDQLDKFVQLVVTKIRETQIRLVFVGLGAPKQEYFIDALAHHASMYQRIKVTTQEKHISDTLTLDALTHQAPLVLMSVGGSFDILAGRVARAPFIMRHLGLEWLWRLTREPWRWRRQRTLFAFLLMIIRESLSKRVN